MMASKLLKADHGSGRFVRFLDRVFGSLRRRYEGRLHRTLDRRPVTILVLVAVMAATAIMYMTSQRELAPEEDQGILFNVVKTPQAANLDYLEQATAQLGKVFETVPEKEHVFTINGLTDVHQAFSGILFKPWERARAHAKADPGGTAGQGRRYRQCAGVHVSAALAAGIAGWRVGAVRDHDHGRLSPARASAR